MYEQDPRLARLQELRLVSKTLSGKSLQSEIQAIYPSAPSNVDPSVLDEVINLYVERFDRLKFLFLEQESKEQFLRLVLEQNDKEINRDAILQSSNEAKQKKQELELKKKAVDLMASDINDKIDQVMKLGESLDQHTTTATKLITDTDEKMKRVAQLREAIDGVNRQSEMIYQIIEMASTVESLDPGTNLNTAKSLYSALENIKLRKSWIDEQTKIAQESLKVKEEHAQQNAAKKNQLQKEKARLGLALEEWKKIHASNNDSLSQQNKQVLATEEKTLLVTALLKKLAGISSFSIEDGIWSIALAKEPENTLRVVMEDDGVHINSFAYPGLTANQTTVLTTEVNAESNPLHTLCSII